MALTPEERRSAEDCVPVRAASPRPSPRRQAPSPLRQAGGLIADAQGEPDCSVATVPQVVAVPKCGALFTAADIDSIMDNLAGKTAVAREVEVEATATVREQPIAVASGVHTQDFSDFANEFFKSHNMEVPAEPEHAKSISKSEKPGILDSWLEDDCNMRERDRGLDSQKPAWPQPMGLSALPAGPDGERADPNADLTSGVFATLEAMHCQKRNGEMVSPVSLKKVAEEAKPLFPSMPLDQLVRALRLFTSQRYEDHDLYLRLLGEIPVQIRGIGPEPLVTCMRVLGRLRLREETYLELFSMEAMNMIRAKRPAPRPRRLVRAAPSAEAAPAPSAAPSPFSPMQLVHIGNALTRLNANISTRFLEIFQEQLGLAIPLLTREECERVCPTFAMSQLLHDPLRRAYLERCTQVEAGLGALPGADAATTAAPDITQYHSEADSRRRRAKHLKNIYITEASVRKENFSFFASLPSEVRTHLDLLHAGSSKLPREPATAFASQVAATLEQLGIPCSLDRTIGSQSLHIVVKAANPRSDSQEVVYECVDTSSFYWVSKEDKDPEPQLTACTKLRHRLLQRLGVSPVHIRIWDWSQMGEAQRINYMVKLQSLQQQ